MTCISGNGLLLWLLSLLHRSEGACPAPCLCTSDSVNCGSAGLTLLPLPLPPTAVTLELSYNRLAGLGPGGFSGLPRLETLRLARNRLATLAPEAFRNASGLRHLDLSSNRLRSLEPRCFRGLRRLEELLLYDNGMVRVDGGVLSGLGSLRKAYFSLNQLTDFPFSSLAGRSHPFLTMLDLSSNRLAAPRWEDVEALPDSLQRGLFLHNNSLTCGCAMYDVFRRWEGRGYYSAWDFADEHACLVDGDAHAAVRFLRRGGDADTFRNCSSAAGSVPATAASSLAAYEGETVRLDCRTSLGEGAQTFTWLTPNQEYVAPGDGGANDSLAIAVFPNGTLEIRAARADDSGLYACTAVDGVRMLNATTEVNVTVVRASHDSFGTGYTTLLGCAVSMVLVLMYLYLTPCRCGCCKQPRPAGVPLPTYDPSALPSVFDPRLGERGEAQMGGAQRAGRHVVFVEPVPEEPSGRLGVGLGAGRLGMGLASDRPVSVRWEWDAAELA